MYVYIYIYICRPYFEGNAIFEGETDGVNISSHSAAVFKRNIISRNALTGMCVPNVFPMCSVVAALSSHGTPTPQ
jgi:hypothetical protein